MQYETFFMFASENFVQVPLPKVTYYIVIQLFYETNYTNDTWKFIEHLIAFLIDEIIKYIPLNF